MQKRVEKKLVIKVFFDFLALDDNQLGDSSIPLPAECHSLNVKNASGESKFLFPVGYGKQAGTRIFCFAECGSIGPNKDT